MSTLHAFAQRLLTEQPLQAGLPPRVEVADEVASQLAFDERWAAFVDGLLDDEALAAAPDDEQALLLLLEVRKPIEALRDVALEFERNWDLVAEHVVGMPVPPVQLLDVRGHRRRGARGGRRACPRGRGRQARGRRSPPSNRWRTSSRRPQTPRDQLRALHRLGRQAGRASRQPRQVLEGWALGRRPRPAAPAGQRRHRPVRARPSRRLAEAALRRLTARVATFTVATAEQRRRRGAARLPRPPRAGPRACSAIPSRGTTVRGCCTSATAGSCSTSSRTPTPSRSRSRPLLAADPEPRRPWPATSRRPLPGRLFFVGDPKQSIYRFRRADIATFLRTRQAVTDQPVHLTANFRTAEPVVDWVNAVFGRLIQAVDDVQPAYQPLLAGPPPDARRPARRSPSTPSTPTSPCADELRAREVADVVAVDPGGPGRLGGAATTTGVARPARPGDIAILLPSRAVLDALEDALDDADIPYRTESSSLAYASREMRDLLLALRAVDDPTDELALVSTLRSPLFGCTDVDLYRWRRERGGRWNLVGGQLPDAGGRRPRPRRHDVPAGRLAAERHWIAPADLLERLVRDRRVLELAGTGAARGTCGAGSATSSTRPGPGRRPAAAPCGRTSTWAYRQASDSIRVTEAVLPETDHDAVRIMTIHAAKGLEFPIVVVAGLTTQHRGRAGPASTCCGPRPAPSSASTTPSSPATYEATRALDEQLDEHERRRLLYVACTRARDHLAVSVHRGASPSSSSTTSTLADAGGRGLQPRSRLAWPRRGPRRWRQQPCLASASGAGVQRTAAGADREPVAVPLDLAAWQAEHTALLAGSGRPRTAAATSFAGHLDAEPRAHDDPGLAKGGVDLDLPPWQKGRYGTAIGRAVHAVLQTVDLATGDGVDDAAAAQAAAEGVVGHERTIAALARSALRHGRRPRGDRRRSTGARCSWPRPIGARRCSRATSTCSTARDDGLVVVDYKTDQPRTDDDLDERVERYRLQLAAYALAVEAVTGERVCPCGPGVLLVVGGRRPSGRFLVWRAAMAAVDEQLLAATAGTPPPLPV